MTRNLLPSAVFLQIIIEFVFIGIVIFVVFHFAL